jgi:hypothetical protein
VTISSSATASVAVTGPSLARCSSVAAFGRRFRRMTPDDEFDWEPTSEPDEERPVEAGEEPADVSLELE